MTNTELKGRIDTLWSETKIGKISRDNRLEAIDNLIESYFKTSGEPIKGGALVRLATLCLYEEISNSHPDKMMREEYPIMSDNQYRRKTEGRHVGRGGLTGKLRPLTREVPLSLAANIAADGREYNYPSRREVDVQEAIDIECYRYNHIGSIAN
ncbi:hypothetical protein MM221_16070 [Salipaludibacillus sp. LMS25]|jgi:hypothetical protein|uniref:hypothetical protein n=1 Tax=Salipaludibacillus sp. LMS25 TaxID=2924031 RepID=UPI0020D0ED7C|nr:hypothetical protein [Salipaludibacillus sp. LMS25]UTR14087.1 hypothetical protein MM221_16070 [Salipaludibacillus sp. LMS25]